MVECFGTRIAYGNARVKFIEEFIAGSTALVIRQRKIFWSNWRVKNILLQRIVMIILSRCPHNLTKERIEELKKDRDTKMADYKHLQD